MTDTFTASNGMTVERDHNNDVIVDRSIGCASVFMADGTALALREFFQHERDEELGRWRWPENPEWLAVEGERSPEGRTVVVVNERTLDRFWFNERVMTIPGDASTAHKAGCAYFEAHPERKPWEDAKPGEVWVLTFDGAEDTFKAYESRYGTIYFTRSRETSTGLVDERITAGRRIWPENAT